MAVEAVVGAVEAQEARAARAVEGEVQVAVEAQVAQVAARDLAAHRRQGKHVSISLLRWLQC